jgi:serine-type D-Ala-D-Ala carboxypeptidase (penicillin-binding protein 5/6)
MNSGRIFAWLTGVVGLVVLMAAAMSATGWWSGPLGEVGPGRPEASAVAPAASDPAPPVVRLDPARAFALDFGRRPPRAGLVFDMATGDALWRRNTYRELPIASLTKVMTALVAVERIEPEEAVDIPHAAINVTGSAVGLKVRRGRDVPAEALMNAMLIQSGNDAAVALAVHAAGSQREFVALMNERAREMGLECTRFVSVHGLEDANRSCVADLARLTRAAMDEPRIAAIARRPKASLRVPIPGGRLEVASTNPLLQSGYPGTVGLKTGYTNTAGQCLIGVVERGSERYGVILLRSPAAGEQGRQLLGKAFRSG